MTPNHLALIAAAVLAAPLSAQQPTDLAPYLMTDRAAEIALARTAAPSNISDSATVIVLTKKGFVEAVHGTNGFTCMVQRSFFAGFSDPNFWYAENRSPVCINPPAVRTVLPEILKRGEWIMGGLSTKEVAKRTKDGYASHAFPMPAPGAMAYMLSSQQILAPTTPHWMPHLMFYFDKSSPAGAWGMGDANGTVIDAPWGEDSPIRLLLVPVRRWSDGKPAM
jgi:hypothetical protein